MNTINESKLVCGIYYNPGGRSKCNKKIKGLEVAFSMVLFIAAVCGVVQASSIVISIVSLIQ